MGTIRSEGCPTYITGRALRALSHGTNKRERERETKGPYPTDWNQHAKISCSHNNNSKATLASHTSVHQAKEQRRTSVRFSSIALFRPLIYSHGQQLATAVCYSLLSARIYEQQRIYPLQLTSCSLSANMQMTQSAAAAK